jgi:imidazolonepropionase
LAGEVGAIAVSHLEKVFYYISKNKISEKGIEVMSKNEIIGVLLPTTAYILRIEYPPCRKLIENDIPISLGTDFNPNAHCIYYKFNKKVYLSLL